MPTNHRDLPKASVGFVRHHDSRLYTPDAGFQETTELIVTADMPRKAAWQHLGPCMDGSPFARGSLSACSCWLVRPCIRPVDAACHVPLAIMPFARLRSRS